MQLISSHAENYKHGQRHHVCPSLEGWLAATIQPKIRPAVSNKEIPKARSKDSDKGVGKLDPKSYNQTCYGLLRVVCSPMSKRVKTSPHPTPRCSSTEMWVRHNDLEGWMLSGQLPPSQETSHVVEARGASEGVRTCTNWFWALILCGFISCLGLLWVCFPYLSIAAAFWRLLHLLFAFEHRNSLAPGLPRFGAV